jgi:hypothetical protein
VEPDEAERGRLLASFARAKKGGFVVFADRIARLFDWSLHEAEARLEELAGDACWGPSLFPGTQIALVAPGNRYPRAMALLLKFDPGISFPRHAHPGGEVTFVLSGAFRDASGVLVERGSELVLQAGSAHTFDVVEGQPCIAAVIAYEGIELV